MIVATAQCLNGVAVIHFPVCSVPLLRHRGRLCQPNKALVSNTKRHCCWSIVTCSASYHIESDGVTVFWSMVPLQSPQGYYGCKSPSHSSAPGQGEHHHQPEQMEGLQHCFPLSSVRLYTAGICFHSSAKWMGATARAQTMNDEIHMKSDESYSTHSRRPSDSSFICEVMIAECLCVFTCLVFFCFCRRGKQVSLIIDDEAGLDQLVDQHKFDVTLVIINDLKQFFKQKSVFSVLQLNVHNSKLNELLTTSIRPGSVLIIIHD